MQNRSFNRITPLTRFGMVSLVVATFVALADPAKAIAPGNSSTFGKTLQEWQNIYWNWALGALSIPTDANNNAVVNGHVVLMPLPAADGSGTPASIDVTLRSGQAFMLPLLMLLGNSYSNGNPDDAFASKGDFRNITLSLKLDGVQIMNGTNAVQYYTQGGFNPVIPISGVPGVAAWIWFQGIGFVHNPLTPGNHTITLDTQNSYPEYGFSVEYHNTWNITVQAGDSLTDHGGE